MPDDSPWHRADKLASIGLLAAGVAHEINNPLAGVMSCLKALQRGSLTPERQTEYFEAARDGLDRIHKIVNSLLDYARQRSLAPAPIAPADVIAGSLALLAPALHSKNVFIDDRSVAGGITVLADRSQLMQASVNVLLNSIQSLEPGGRVVIDVEQRPGRVAIRFRDDGCGIPPELLQRVRDPFFTTKPEGQGTGLGLAVTEGILVAHGGALDIESEVGRGTTVTFWLPVPPGGVS